MLGILYTSTRFLVCEYHNSFDQFPLDLFVFEDLQRRKELNKKELRKNFGKNNSSEAIFQRKG